MFHITATIRPQASPGSTAVPLKMSTWASLDFRTQGTVGEEVCRSVEWPVFATPAPVKEHEGTVLSGVAWFRRSRACEVHLTLGCRCLHMVPLVSINVSSGDVKQCKHSIFKLIRL